MAVTVEVTAVAVEISMVHFHTIKTTCINLQVTNCLIVAAAGINSVDNMPIVVKIITGHVQE